MGVVIENSVWEPNSLVFIFLFLCCCLCSIFLSSFAASKHAPFSSSSSFSSSIFDLGLSLSFLNFQRKFLFIYSLASVMEGLGSVLGESEWTYYGLSRKQMAFYLSAGTAASLFIGTFLGVLSDSIGQQKLCLLFCIFHLFVGICKRIVGSPSVWLASTCLSLASSIFSFSFETWMVVEHEKQGHRQDLLSETFWLMAFFESASLIGSQILANWLVGNDLERNIASPGSAIILLALLGIVCGCRGSKGSPKPAEWKNHGMSYADMLGDKRILLLACSQACLHFSIGVFWILWAPTLVADGREVQLGLIYPCLLGSRMLGSTTFPRLVSGSSHVRTEDCLLYAFIVSGLILSIVAYDYQEIGVLVTLFCMFHACIGIMLPSLARLRTMYVPNDLRGGVVSISLAPANAMLLLVLVPGGYYPNVENATVLALAALGLFSAAGCMHMLKRLGKQPYQNWHKS